MMVAVPDSAGMARTVTVPGVELVSAGIWAASTGLTTITAAHLESMVAASRDPSVDGAAVKIGHTDPRFNAAQDGDPALGWVTNLRVEPRTPTGPDGQPVPGAGPVPTLVGDLVGVPAGLAAIMPTAYRRRSVEIGWKYRTPAGAEYSAALTGLALLGVTKPAVKGLADVMALYAAATSVGPSAISGGSARVDATTALAIDPDLPTPAVLALELARSAYTQLAAAGAVPADAVEPWAADLERQVRARLAASGHHVPTTPHPLGGSTVPVDEARIRQLLNLQAGDDIEAAVARLITAPPASQPAAGQTPPAPTAAAPAPGTPAAPAPAAPPQIPPGLAALLQPYLTPPPPAPAAGGAPTPTGQAAPQATPQPAPAAPGTVAGAGPAPATPAPAPAAAAPAPPAQGFQLPEGMALVSQTVLDELRAGAVAGIASAQELARQGVERDLAAALSAGKIAPAELDAWRTSLLTPASSAQARALLTAMQPRFSTTATTIGSGADVNANVEAATWEAWESNVFGIPPSTVPQAAAFAGAIPTTATPAPAPAAAPPMTWGYDTIRGYVPMLATPPQGA